MLSLEPRKNSWASHKVSLIIPNMQLQGHRHGFWELKPQLFVSPVSTPTITGYVFHITSLHLNFLFKKWGLTSFLKMQ